MSFSKGNLAEKKAVDFLKSKGFTIIEQNFYAKKLGELDIIALKDDTYHFIEVKSATLYEVAINNVSASKLSKIKRSIAYYLQIKKLDVFYSVDVVVVVDNKIDFLENISM